MKYFSILLVLAAFALAGCGSAANNTSVISNAGNNANMRGANTNTGYVTNTDTNAKPAVPANATNISPGNMTSGSSNARSNANTNSSLRTSPKAKGTP